MPRVQDEPTFNDRVYLAQGNRKTGRATCCNNDMSIYLMNWDRRRPMRILNVPMQLY